MPAKFEGVMPEMPVRDVRAAVEHYRDVLSFEGDYVYGDNPVYAIVKRDHTRIALLNARDSDPGDGRCYIFVDGIEEYFVKVKAAKADIIIELGERPYGMKDFALRDLDGNRLAFGCSIETGEDCEKRERHPATTMDTPNSLQVEAPRKVIPLNYAQPAWHRPEPIAQATPLGFNRGKLPPAEAIAAVLETDDRGDMAFVTRALDQQGIAFHVADIAAGTSYKHPIRLLVRDADLAKTREIVNLIISRRMRAKSLNQRDGSCKTVSEGGTWPDPYTLYRQH